MQNNFTPEYKYLAHDKYILIQLDEELVNCSKQVHARDSEGQVYLVLRKNLLELDAVEEVIEVSHDYEEEDFGNKED